MRFTKTFIVIVLCAAFQLLAPASPVLAYDDNPYIQILVEQPMNYIQWHDNDQIHVEQIIEAHSDDSAYVRGMLLQEWQAITEDLARDLAGGYTEARGQYTVYTANCSGKIHVLSLAKYYREKVLEDLLAGGGFSEPYPNLWSGSNPAGIPGINRDFTPASGSIYGLSDVVDTVNDIQVPEDTFRGVSFYLLPFKITDYAALTYSKGTPGRDEAIYLSARSQDELPTLPGIIDHETGHYIHYQFMGAYTQDSAPWRAFMDLIGQAEYADNSYPFQEITNENFAEYFRFTYGSPQGRAAMAFLGGYNNPADNAWLQNGFRQMVSSLIAQGDRPYYDVNHMSMSFFGYAGKASNVPVGLRPEQINTVVTTSPRVVFFAPLLLRSGENILPIAACFQQGSKTDIDHAIYGINPGAVRYQVDLPREGVYSLYLGETDDSLAITKFIQFTVIYTAN